MYLIQCTQLFIELTQIEIILKIFKLNKLDLFEKHWKQKYLFFLNNDFDPDRRSRLELEAVDGAGGGLHQ